MLVKYKHLAALLLVAAVQGCSVTSNDNGPLANLVIAEPMAVHYKSEIALARLTEVIHRAEISDAQRAQLYYDRGVIYDSVGLRSLARLDFNRALKLKPDLIEAYNFIGIHYTQLQEFNQAYEKFDSALELAPEHEYAYLNRGIALYYGGRPQLAADDFLVFLDKQKNDPYRILWLYLAEKDVNAEQALIDLKARANEVERSVWARQVIQLYLGEISHQQFMNNLTKNVDSNKALTDRLCEAYFYLAKLYQAKGDQRTAANYFKLALSTNVYEFVEHRYAKLEIDLMRSTLKAQPE